MKQLQILIQKLNKLKAHNTTSQLDVGVGLLLGKRANLIDLCAVDIAVGIVVQQVAHGAYSHLRGKQLRTLFAHATQKFYVHIGSHKAKIT